MRAAAAQVHARPALCGAFRFGPRPEHLRFALCTPAARPAATQQEPLAWRVHAAARSDSWACSNLQGSAAACARSQGELACGRRAGCWSGGESRAGARQQELYPCDAAGGKQVRRGGIDAVAYPPYIQAVLLGEAAQAVRVLQHLDAARECLRGAPALHRIPPVLGRQHVAWLRGARPAHTF